MFFRSISVFLFVLVLAACTEPPYKNINNEQLKSLMEQGVPIYDIRRQDEWHQTGMIEGSIPLTFIAKEARVNPDFFPNFTRSMAKNSSVILICRTGTRTRKLAAHLADNFGYTQIYNVRNGITEWIKEGNEVVRKRF